MEPSAMLVAAFEIKIGGPGHIRLVPKHGGVARPRFEPHVEDVRFLLELGSAAVGALATISQNGVGFRRVPGIRAALKNKLPDLAVHKRIMDGLAALVAEKDRDWNSPHPLPRNTPVG